MSPHRALIIEDNADLATIFAEALKAAGFTTSIVQDGGQAMAQLLELLPSVIILDLHLPQISGQEILEQIRAHPQLHRSRVIIATADAGLSEELPPQADLILLKPISFIQLATLATRLHATLGNK